MKSFGVTPVTAARLHANNKDIKFEQDPYRVRLTGLPESAPDHPITTIAIECDAEPKQDNIFVRREKPRRQVNVSLA